MKTQLLFPVVLALCVSLVSHAAAAGADSPRASLVRTEDLSFIAVGSAYEKELRMLTDISGDTYELEAQHMYGFAAIDILPWLTINGAAGISEIKPAPLEGYGDDDSLWMAGVTASLWEHVVEDPSFLACLCRLQLSHQHWERGAEFGGTDIDWEEDRTSLTLRTEFFVDTEDQRLSPYPYSVVFIVGPVYSEVDMTVPQGGRFPLNGAKVTEDRDLGVLLGVDLLVASNFSVGWEGRIYKEATHSINLVFHF